MEEERGEDDPERALKTRRELASQGPRGRILAKENNYAKNKEVSKNLASVENNWSRGCGQGGWQLYKNMEK